MKIYLSAIILLASLATEFYRVYLFFEIEFSPVIALSLALILCLGFLLVHLYKPSFSAVYTVLIGILAFYVLALEIQNWAKSSRIPLYVPQEQIPIYEHKYRYYEQEKNYLKDLEERKAIAIKKNLEIDKINQKRKLEAEQLPLFDLVRKVLQAIFISCIFPFLMYFSLSVFSESLKSKDDEISKIIKDYKTGKSVTEIAKKTKKSRQAIYRILDSKAVRHPDKAKQDWTSGLEGRTE